MRLRVLEVGEAFARDAVAAGAHLDLFRADLVNLCGIEPEDLRPQRRRDFRIAIRFAELLRDLESAEGLDLILG